VVPCALQSLLVVAGERFLFVRISKNFAPLPF
jgi:hypothetical protein